MSNILYHVFSTRKDKYYVYDYSSHSILEIEEDIYKKLQKSECKSLLKEPLILNMQNQGFLLPKKDYITQNPISDNIKELLESNLRMLILQVTQGCNLRCSYCVYGGNYSQRQHSNLNMDKITAFKAIDFFVEHSRNTPVLTIGFYGGEPLLEFNLIKECVEYAKKKSNGKKYVLA